MWKAAIQGGFRGIIQGATGPGQELDQLGLEGSADT